MQVSFGREVASVLLKMCAVLLTFILIIGGLGVWYETEIISDGECNIAVLPIEGVILPFASYEEYDLVVTPGQVRSFLELASEDPFIKGIVYEINSPGGTPVASEQISELIKENTLPSISLVGDIAASGGYLIAASADTIVASGMSDIGSIGVTMSYLESSKKNEEEGLTYVELTSAKFKDAGNPDKAITEEEKELFKQDLAVIHDLFVKKVAEARSVPVEKIQALADGSSMPGVKALEAGLIDAIGGRTVAKSILAESLQMPVEEIVFCEYQTEELFI
jgi:protease-4